MKQKQSYLSEQCDSIELLILGTSHAGAGLNPTLFKLNAFNAANGSQSLYYDIEITKKYLNRMNQLKYVLISIDYHSLYFTHEPNRDFMYDYYYGIDYKNKSSNKNILSILIQGYGLKNGISMITKQPSKLLKGWDAFTGTSYSDLNRHDAKVRVDGFNKKIKNNLQNKDDIIKDLNAFIELLKSKKITPILLTLPCHLYYLEEIDPFFVESNERDIKQLQLKHDIKYLNFLNEKLPNICFYNVNHLNKLGAKIMTTKINEYIFQIEQNKNRSNLLSIGIRK